METKKISFGFLKTKKQDKPLITETKEYIECVEEKAIKVVGGEPAKENTPLVILMKPNTLITAEKLKKIAEQAENFDDIMKQEDSTKTSVPENETLEQMAARELLEEANKKKDNKEDEKLVVRVPSQPVLDGQKESTLDDYDSVPVQDFGLAMLRGMGWTPGKDESKYKLPQLRPKGLGLGADKVIAQKQSKKSQDNEEELVIVKKAYVKVTSGKYSGLYGQVLSLDEDNGRAMVDITMRKETVSLSEFMMHAVSKSEYDKQAKVINAESYAEYKRNEIDKSSRKERIDNTSGHRSSERSDTRHRDVEDKHSNGKKKLERRDSGSENERSKSRSYKKFSSSESDSDRRNRRRSSSSSESNYRHKKKKSHSKSSKEKRDIDKKRKGKKKKRDRDRSPNYKKHRK